ncbi:MAG TPA: uroporphyrinogen-III synthase [Gemmatimonadales bacterium]
MRVVLTMGQDTLTGLAEALGAMGLEVKQRPLISFLPLGDWGSFDHALLDLDSFNAIAVTSPRAAAVLAARIPRKPCPVPVWVTGETTAALLADTMKTVHLVEPRGDQGAAEAVAEAMISAGVASPVFFPCGDRRRDALVIRLRAAGFEVRSELCYHSVIASAEETRAACEETDVVVVGSPSVARRLASSVDARARPRLVALGHSTATEAEHAGWKPDAVATHPTVEAVVTALTSPSRPQPSAS